MLRWRQPHNVVTAGPAGRGGGREAIRAAEALRFGLVPISRMRELTIGFDDLEAWAAEQLPDANDGKPVLAEISGAFGAGKSHAMATIRQFARDRGYLTARVEVDGQRISLSDPEKLLFAIWSSLTANDLNSATPLLDVYLRAMDASALTPRVAPDGIDRIHDNYWLIRELKRSGHIDVLAYALDALVSSSDEYTATQVVDEIARESNLARQEIVARRMIGRIVVDRPFDFIESIAGHALIAKQAGYAGIVVTIDEFEVEYNLSRQQLERVAALLRALGQYLRGETGHKPAPLAIYFASVGQDGHLGDAIIGAMLEHTGGERYQLDPLERPERRILAGQIMAVYGEAYEIDIENRGDLVDSVEATLERYEFADSGITRAFIKRLLAVLDSEYGPPASA